jgi:hypothetical protein
MFRVTATLLLLIACHGSNPPAEPEAPGEAPLPPIDGDTEPSNLPPEPNAPGDARTLSPSSGVAAASAPGTVAASDHVGGTSGMGGFGGISGVGGSTPVARP